MENKEVELIKDWVKDKDLDDYTNPVLPIVNPIYVSKKYLKWEDLETTKIYRCLLNGNKYFVDFFEPQECDPHWRARLISPNRGVFIILKEYDKQFFDDLHLEVLGVIE